MFRKFLVCKNSKNKNTGFARIAVNVLAHSNVLPLLFFGFILVLAYREHLRCCFLVCPEVRVELGKWRAVKRSVGEMQIKASQGHRWSACATGTGDS